MTHRITLVSDHHEDEEFANWLREQGHDVTLGGAGNYVDDTWTSLDADASDILNSLWEAYCAS